MTYSIDFRKQVLRSIKDGMTIREAANLYQLSISSIHSWQQSLAPTLLGLCMKRCCLHLITLNRILTATYSMTGAKIH